MLILCYSDITRYIANYNDISCFVKWVILTSTRNSLKLLGKSLTEGRGLAKRRQPSARGNQLGSEALPR
jgi:hypothetical protein